MRRLFYLVFLASLTLPAIWGQNCSVNPGTRRTLRAEGQAELLDDVVITCSGFPATPAGQAPPTYALTVSLNVPITSRDGEPVLIVDGETTPKAEIQRAAGGPAGRPVFGTLLITARLLTAMKWIVSLDPVLVTHTLRIGGARADAAAVQCQNNLAQLGRCRVQEKIQMIKVGGNATPVFDTSLLYPLQSQSFSVPGANTQPGTTDWNPQLFKTAAGACPDVTGLRDDGRAELIGIWNSRIAESSANGPPSLNGTLAQFQLRGIMDGVQVWIPRIRTSGTVTWTLVSIGDDVAIPPCDEVRVPTREGQGYAVYETTGGSGPATLSMPLNFSWAAGVTPEIPEVRATYYGLEDFARALRDNTGADFGRYFEDPPSWIAQTSWTRTGAVCAATAPAQLEPIASGPIVFEAHSTPDGSFIFNGPGIYNLPFVSKSCTRLLTTPSISFDGTQAIADSLRVSRAATPASWLTATFTQPGTPGTLTFSADATGLPRGTYTARVSVAVQGTTTPVVIPVTLKVDPPGPFITKEGVVSAANYIPYAVAPGLLTTIFGTGFGPADFASGTLTAGAFSTTLANTQVLFDNIPAPIIYVANGQIAVLVPFALDGAKTTQVQVVYNGVKSSPVTLAVAPAEPGLLSADSSGGGPGAILNQDYTLNSAAKPAAAGTVVLIYAIGGGQTTPPGRDGRVVNDSNLPVPKLPVSLTIGGKPAQTLYAGDAPSLAEGILQINAVVPAGLPAGPNPVVLKVGDYSSPSWVTVEVGP